ncbi:MAG: homoserine dehydrogenase [Caldimicrobium sp.]|nr:homoserine dehydrogenase [Caldimicrobium sp.]MCX7612825.1 homoserine dehydrogenase [Caldimicrobium sp.]MDW8183303.1 homoserine dehydrogenase [Caldimicrobium sp.]
MIRINIALLGLGTVGQGVYELWLRHRERLREKVGVDLEIKKILVRDISKRRNIGVPDEKITVNFEEICQDRDISIVCELMGGIEPAKTYIRRLLEAGKQVVTANKAVLAEYGGEIFELATKRGAYLGFEASVGGGIPVIKILREALIGNRVESILGIINGTTNYILTRMLENNLSFERALEEAKQRGYAEADPTLDLTGLDSAHKISILASLAFGVFIPSHRIYVEGINEIDLMDLKFAKQFGYIVKLLAEARESRKGFEIRVYPALLPENHILTSIRLNYNAIYIKGDFVGDVLLYGLGAGKEPTASAVMSDIVSAVEYLRFNKFPLIKYPLREDKDLRLVSVKDSVFRYYFRFSVVDRPGVLSKISGVLGNHGISISSVVQIGRQIRKGAVPIVMLTHETREEQVVKALEEIDQLDIVKAKTKRLRIFE